MTFVNKKTRVFYDRGDIKPERRRSEARLKKYSSSIDIRNWCDVVEDRRQHILELITKGYADCRENIIPLNAIVNAALQQKNADLRDIQKCINQMWSFVEKVNLSNDDRDKLEQLKQEMGSKCRARKLSSLSNLPDSRTQKSKKKKQPRKGVIEGKDYLKDLEDVEGKGGKPMKYTVRSGPEETTKIHGLREGVIIEDVPDETRDGMKPKKITTNAYSEDVGSDGTEHSPASPPSTKDAEKEQKYTVRSAGPGKVTTKIFGLRKGFYLEDVETSGGKQKKIIRNAYPKEPDSDDAEKGDTEESKGKHTKETEEPVSTDPEDQSGSVDILFSSRKANIPKEKKPTGVNDNLGEEIIQLKDQLAARDALCNEQRMNIENLKNERDKLKKKIEDCLKELEELRNINNVADPTIASSCKEEIDALEREIKDMRSGNSSPEEEALVIQKEVEILLKYCMKLKEVERENEKLKNEISTIKMPVHSTPMQITEGYKSTPINEIKEPIIEDSKRLSQDSNNKKLKELMPEGPGTMKEITQIFRAPNGVNPYKDKAEMLDNVLAERDALKKQLQKLKGVEKENENLRKNLGRVEQQVSTIKPKGKVDFTELELKKTLSRCTCLEKEIQNLRKEREVMAKRIEVMKLEVETLRPKAREAEMLKLERDKLQIKLNELSYVQIHNENLMLKCKCLEGAVTERDTYKRKYEDILTMECQCDVLKNQAEENKLLVRERDSLKTQIEDLKTCIHEQEDEIKRLMGNIDEIMRSKEDAQTRMKDALANMREEIENKDSIIALSEERLASVQTQLKSSIQGVSCEAICYKTRLEELERELLQSQRTIKTLKQKNQNTNGQIDLVENMKRELAEAREENRKLQEIAKQMALVTGDEHVQKMLKQSECAVKRVVEELGKQYKEWDLLKHKQTHVPSSKEHLYATRNDFEIKNELEVIKKEKEKLERIVAEIKNEKFARSSQKMMEHLKSENEKLKSQLKKEIELRKALQQKIN